jgi:hypothetical protein
MSKYNYVPIDTIFSKLVRDLGEEHINESDIIEWSAEALEAIGAVTLYEEAVTFLEVKDYQVELPRGLHAIIQIAKSNAPYVPTKDFICARKMFEEVQEEKGIEPCPPREGVKLDCNGEFAEPFDVAYYRPFYSIPYDYVDWRMSAHYRGFSPVRLANHTFFNSVVCQEMDRDAIYQSCTDEYTLIQKQFARFNFKEGLVAIAYIRQVVDKETGYPMIPDHYSYKTAITKYITYRIMERQFYAGREGSQGRMQKAEADWHWYCKQAGNDALMPNGIDDLQNILESRYYLLPDLGKYYSFFGNLGRPQNNNFQLR